MVTREYGSFFNFVIIECKARVICGEITFTKNIYKIDTK